jgi:hypothetical protein
LKSGIALEILSLDTDVNLAANPPNLIIVQEVRAIKAEQVATSRPADALTCGREVLRWNPPRPLMGLWAELTGAAANWIDWSKGGQDYRG